MCHAIKKTFFLRWRAVGERKHNNNNKREVQKALEKDFKFQLTVTASENKGLVSII